MQELRRGRDQARHNRLIVVEEQTFMRPDPAGVPELRLDLGSDGNGLSTPQTWSEHIPDGVNMAGGRALVGEEALITRNFMPHYRSMERVLRDTCGLPISDVDIDLGSPEFPLGRRKLVFIDPETGAPAVPTHTGYYGLKDVSARLTGGKVQSWNIDVSRNADAGSLTGNMVLHYQRIEHNKPVPGLVAANEVRAFIADGATNDAVFTMPATTLGAGGSLTITRNMTQAAFLAAVKALAGYNDAGVTAVATGVGATDGVYLLTLGGALANTHITNPVKVSGTGWTTELRTLGTTGILPEVLTGPYMESNHVTCYLALSDADRDSIDYADMPDEFGLEGDDHLMADSPSSTFSIGDLWKSFWSQNGQQYSTDFIAGARNVAASVSTPNDPTPGSDCDFLLMSQYGCNARGFHWLRMIKCDGYEFLTNLFGSRSDAPGYGADNDVYMKDFAIGRLINPEGTGSLIYTLILPNEAP